MSEYHDRTNSGNNRRGRAVNPDAISDLVATLTDNDGFVRQRARRALVRIGKPAVPPLVRALADSKERVRWEAAKALATIGDRKAAPALVNALKDESFGVRWLAAEGLINLHGEGLVPLLQELVREQDSVQLREGAHHVLKSLAKEGLHARVAPVLAALEDIEPETAVPVAAQAILDSLTESH